MVRPTARLEFLFAVGICGLALANCAGAQSERHGQDSRVSTASIPPVEVERSSPDRDAGWVGAGAIERLDPTPLCTSSDRVIPVAGRMVRVVQPTTTRRVPVIVALHGFKESPDRLAYFSNLDSVARSGEAIIVYPPGTPLDLGYGWNSGAARFATHEEDDVAFIASVVDEIRTLRCADQSRVILVGESNGGGMVVRAACDSRLVGDIDTLVLVNPALDTSVLSGCDGRQDRIRLLAVTGSLDRIIPPDGSRKPFVAARTWFSSLANELSTCSGRFVDIQSSESTVSIVAASDCLACALLVNSADGGHTWPGAMYSLNNAPIGSFRLTEEIEWLATEGTGCIG